MSKFRPATDYQSEAEQGYGLLPFRFASLDDSAYVLTNEVGEPLILDRSTLEDFVRHRLPLDSPAYLELKARHFLEDRSSSIAQELLALKLRTKLRRLAEFTSLHIFVVSLRCEHACPYCQVSRQSDDKLSFDMTTQTADRALDVVFASPAQAIKIEFQGGEPLLNFALIRHIVAEAERRNTSIQKNLAFVIATNLALLNDEVLQYCAEHSILISTSLDGPSDIHNRNRPRPGGDSYERAIRGIHRAREVLGRDSVSALMTTTQASLGRVRDIVDEYLRQGFAEIFLRPVSPYGFAVKTKTYSAYDVERWLEFYFEGLDYIIELNRSGIHFVERYAATVLTKMLTPFEPGYVDLMSPAGIGIAAIVYNYNGAVYASDESRMLAEMGDEAFKLGDLETAGFKEIFTSDNLLTALDESFAGSVPMCCDCAFQRWCGADPVFHHATQGDNVGRKPISAFCNRNMAVFEGLLARINRDAETRGIFRRWARR